MKFRWATGLLGLLLVCAPLRATAQAALPYKNVISANPFLILFEWFNGEFERTITTSSTMGVRASVIKFDDARYVSGRAFYRYYPSGALTKFYLGVSGGVSSVDADGEDGAAVGALGFELGYNWLLGARQKLYVSLGVGADRLFGLDVEGVAVAIPTLRVLNVGFAF